MSLKTRLLHLMFSFALLAFATSLALPQPSTASAASPDSAKPKLATQISTTSLSASPNPAILTNSIALTATVSGATTTPTGSVIFKDGTTTIGVATLSSGVAILSVSSLSLGTHLLTATYGGNSTYLSSVSNVVTEVVINNVLTGTLNTLTSSLNPATVGQSVTFTATITSLGNLVGVNPTGSVTFYDGSTALGTVSIPAGTSAASYTTSSLTSGSHSITAYYAGDATFASSTSTAVVQVINDIPQTINTSTALVSSANPTLLSSTVTFTATVTPGTGSGVPAGSVTFKDGTTVLGTATLSGGVATFTASNLSLGTHLVTATYGGNSTYLSSVSNVVTEVIISNVLTGTLTTVTSSLNPATAGQSVTFTASVASLGNLVGIDPTGTVVFYDGNTVIASLPLPAGSTSVAYTISNLSTGSHSITAAYGGDTNYASSTSATLTQIVNNVQTAVDTTAALVSSANPAVLAAPVTFTATVSASSGSAAPTGSVTFYDGVTPIGSGMLSAGSGNTAVASVNTTNLGLGVHSITANYAGNSSFNSSTSNTVSELVVNITLVGTTTSVVSSANPATVGNLVVFTAQVVANTGLVVPTGSVTFYDGSTSIGIANLSGTGLASVSISTLAVGSHSITAVYSGDNAFATSTSTAFNQQINNQSLLAPVITLTANPNPAVAGQPVTMTVTVRNLNGQTSPLPTGLITFLDNNGTLASVTLDANGNATYVVSGLTAGTHSLTASYSGDSNYGAGTSNAISEVISNPAPGQTATTTVLSSSTQAPILNQTVTFTATVSAVSGSTVPNGIVTFYDGLVSIGTANLDASGNATLNVSNLTLGVHVITASYAGNTNFVASTSNPLTEVVANTSLLPTTTSLVSSLNPVAVGTSVTFTATVNALGVNNGPLTGQVIFWDGANQMITTTIAAGSNTAVFTTSSLSVGTHSIMAQYLGNAIYAGNNSSTINEVVKTVTECLVVTSNLDDNSCGTLREAIQLSNGLLATGPVTVTVSSPVITLTSALPVISNNTGNLLSIMAPCSTDTAAAPGYTRGLPGTKLLRATGATFTGAGFSLTNNIKLQGFAIAGFAGYGITLNGNGNILACNWVGTSDGMTALANTSGGVQIKGSNNQLGIAGQPASGNLISGNTGYGISVETGSNNLASYNWVGYGKNGSTVLSNTSGGVRVQSGASLKLSNGNRVHA